MDFFSYFFRKLGFDKAIVYTLMGKGLQISTAIFSVLFITKFLTPDQQGFFYTFGSIVAIQVFFELGLTGIITQFVAHEVAHLNVTDRFIEGPIENASRLASLLKICAKWYSIISIGLFLILTIVGIVFFSKYGETFSLTVSWKSPWALLVLGTVVNFLVTPIVAIIEGLGYVKDIAKFRMVQQIVQPIVLCGGLWFGAGLFVSGIDVLLRSLLICFLICTSPIIKVLSVVWHQHVTCAVSYKKEIFPYQWRIAVSWISGYFIFQLFNPVLFATEGPTVAGQMGMTMQALNSLQALTMAWINTKVPTISRFIALKRYFELDQLFGKTFKQVLFIGVVFICIFVIIVSTIQHCNIHLFSIDLGGRFLSGLPLLLLAFAVMLTFPINCWAAYLRSHKREPLMINSVVMGILCCISTLTMGNLYGLFGIVCGYSILRFFSTIWIYYVFRQKKREWHHEEE